MRTRRREVFPPDVSLGVLLLRTGRRWEEWLPARGPIRLARRRIALVAARPVLQHLDDLPRRLAGLDLARLPLDDDGLRRLVRRCRRLTWLDLRGTAVTPDGLLALRRLRRLRRVGLDGPAPAGLAWKVAVATGDAVLVDPSRPDVAPDRQALDALVARAVRDHPGLRTGDAHEAAVRADVLTDAGRPAQALALLAPHLPGAGPSVAVAAAHAARALGSRSAAVAALVATDPTPAVVGFRASVVAPVRPAAAIRYADQVLALVPEDHVALWALCTAYRTIEQPESARAALTRLESVSPGHVDTLWQAVSVARTPREQTAALRAVLAARPDDAKALATMSRLKRSPSPYASMRLLAAAAEADVASYGRTLIVGVTNHRRLQATFTGFMFFLADVRVGEKLTWLQGRPLGLFVVAAVAFGLGVSRYTWWRTPPSVRDVIRRTDALTGAHRAPNWRIALVAMALAGATFALPSRVEAPEDRCDDPCPPRIVTQQTLRLPPPAPYLPPLPSIPSSP
jgi:hypothetical protein